jgi:tetratricopeptide (TPR) repeat protein
VKSQFAFSTPAFFELLLCKSREEGRQDRQRGVEVAKLALESLEAIEGLGNQLPNFRVRAWAWIGHTHRLAFEFPDAEKACVAGENEWATIGLVFRDDRAVAELWLAKAALRTWQREFDEALALTNPAISTLKLHPDSQSYLTKGLVLKGIVLGYKGDHRSALVVLREADEFAEHHSDPSIRLAIQTELAVANLGVGLLAEARASLEKARRLCVEVGGKFFGSLLDWIEGLFEEQSGRPQHAQRKFIKAREDFGELGEMGYYAVVSLDLAILGVKLGDVDELLTLAAEAATALESLKVHRELFVALKLLRTGLDTQQISLALLEKARHLMEKTRPLGFGSLK